MSKPVDSLLHYGVKGMKWGVRKTKEHSNYKPSKQDEMSHVKLKNYNGKTYFISEHNMDGETLIPRVPQNYFTKNGYEDSKTNRVSFAPSVDKALMGLSQNVTGKKFYVHEPAGKHDIYKPNLKAVPDAGVTGELWIKDPVKLKKVGEISVTGDSGKPGKKFKYGNNSAELYEFNYEWTVRHSMVNDSLLHYGVKGMKWDETKPQDSVALQNIVKKYNLTPAQAQNVQKLVMTMKANQASAPPTQNQTPSNNSSAPAKPAVDPKANADKLVNDAKVTASRTIEQAKAAADRTIKDAKMAADKILKEAKLKAEAEAKKIKSTNGKSTSGAHKKPKAAKKSKKKKATSEKPKSQTTKKPATKSTLDARYGTKEIRDLVAKQITAAKLAQRYGQ